MTDKLKDSSEQRALGIQHVDLPELSETFADSIDLVFFDGQTLRINFGVTRFEQQQASSASAKRFPSCRLVLTAGAAVELMNQIQQLTARMVQAGVLKTNAQASPEKSAKKRGSDGRFELRFGDTTGKDIVCIWLPRVA